MKKPKYLTKFIVWNYICTQRFIFLLFQSILKFKVSKRRAGDIEASIASPMKAKQMLGWSSSYSLEEMCVSAFNFYKKHPNAINLKC